MRKILCVTVLMLAICCPALAGEIPNPPAPQPPPQGLTAPDPTTGDEPPTGDDVDAPVWPDSLAETLFDLLSILPTLL